MFPIVARFATGTAATPGPKNSTNVPTTPTDRSSSAMVSTRSVAVAPSGSCPDSRTPITLGISMDSGWPSIAASASMPPTPQPSTPSPLTIGVCESVPISVSGNAVPSSANTTRARCSMLTWWQIPVPGGTRSPGSACCPQRRNAYRSALRRYSSSMFALKSVPTAEEVRDHRVVDDQLGRAQRAHPRRCPRPARPSPPASWPGRPGGTPVKSCSSTRAGVNARSRPTVRPPGSTRPAPGSARR